MGNDKHSRLIEKALRLKKAWLCMAALVGGPMTDADVAFPSFGKWENRKLKDYTETLEDDIDSIARIVLLEWKRTQMSQTVEWFASAYDAWNKAGLGLFELGRVQQIEEEVGPLGFRKAIECPPYGQVLLQGWNGAAVRHPEYHLAQDLGLLFNLFLDSE
jgi:hypothetical protein